jgi:hypothetical protein
MQPGYEQFEDPGEIEKSSISLAKAHYGFYKNKINNEKKDSCKICFVSTGEDICQGCKPVYQHCLDYTRKKSQLPGNELLGIPYKMRSTAIAYAKALYVKNN